MLVIILLEYLLIISYLIKSVYLGLLFWLLIVIYTGFHKRSSLDFFVKLVVLSIPISYQEINCEPGIHIFKWYNAAVLCLQLLLLTYILLKHIKVNRNIFLMLFFTLSCQIIRTAFCKRLDIALRELMQEYIVVLTVFLFWVYKNGSGRIYDYNTMAGEWTKAYYAAAIATSLGLLTQYALYLAGRPYGSFTIWTGRKMFDLLFTGASVLPVFLGAAIIIATQRILSGGNLLFHSLVLILSSFASAINSSRSGFLSAILIEILVFFDGLRKRKTIKRTILFVIPIIMIIAFALSYLIQNRVSLQGGNLIAGNGRMQLMESAFEMMFSDFGTFLFGVGINGASVLNIGSQHNMFLEMWTLNGTPFLIVFMIAVLMILWKTRKSEDRFLLWQILLAHQFYSSFFATTFLLPVLLIVISTTGHNEIRALPCAETVS